MFVVVALEVVGVYDVVGKLGARGTLEEAFVTVVATVETMRVCEEIYLAEEPAARLFDWRVVLLLAPADAKAQYRSAQEQKIAQKAKGMM